jgi:hypothetical protein
MDGMAHPWKPVMPAGASSSTREKHVLRLVYETGRFTGNDDADTTQHTGRVCDTIALLQQGVAQTQGMATVSKTAPSLRLVARNGSILPAMGPGMNPANGGESEEQALSDAEGYDEVISTVVSLRSRLDGASDLRRDLGLWLAELELARARQRKND